MPKRSRAEDGIDPSKHQKVWTKECIDYWGLDVFRLVLRVIIFDFPEPMPQLAYVCRAFRTIYNELMNQYVDFIARQRPSAIGLFYLLENTRGMIELGLRDAKADVYSVTLRWIETPSGGLWMCDSRNHKFIDIPASGITPKRQSELFYEADMLELNIEPQMIERSSHSVDFDGKKDFVWNFDKVAKGYTYDVRMTFFAFEFDLYDEDLLEFAEFTHGIYWLERRPFAEELLGVVHASSKNYPNTRNHQKMVLQTKNQHDRSSLREWQHG